MNQKKVLKEIAYNKILKKIIKSDYKPNSFLNEQMLTEELKISRTPIHEALVRLEENHLVKIMPKKGILVTAVTPEVISSIYEVRLVFEPYIIQTYGDKIDLKKMKKTILDYQKTIDEEGLDKFNADSSFHMTIWNTCSNNYIVQTLNSVNLQNERISVLAGTSKSRLQVSQEEHSEIFEYIENKDYELAAEKIKTHLLNGKEAALNAIISKWI